jgi:hypothetical protein
MIHSLRVFTLNKHHTSMGSGVLKDRFLIFSTFPCSHTPEGYNKFVVIDHYAMILCDFERRLSKSHRELSMIPLFSMSLTPWVCYVAP